MVELYTKFAINHKTVENYDHNNSDRVIYKMKINGTDSILLHDAVDDYVYGINVVGDWIYYSTNYVDTLVYYKIKTDGTEHQEVN